VWVPVPVQVPLQPLPVRLSADGSPSKPWSSRPRMLDRSPSRHSPPVREHLVDARDRLAGVALPAPGREIGRAQRARVQHPLLVRVDAFVGNVEHRVLADQPLA
jgi:hypothetical protein